ncbi:hypothetical protein [Longitalea luteola]|uniref:hypothetical protein n=1 Tax=Longitalea luteola TaxID=2812563 RepID=UPI001A960493|nr:hypothetical protein [Longitalea luteola]
MKKLILLPFLVFGQFLTNAQPPTKKAQQVITLKLMPAGPIHLPKVKKDKGRGNDDKLQLKEELGLSSNKHILVDKQVIEMDIEEKKPPAANVPAKKNEETNNTSKNRLILYTVTSL